LWTESHDPELHPFAERVLTRIEESEINARLGDRDDIRVAWITVRKCAAGHPYPWQQAFWQAFGRTADELVPYLEARAYLQSVYDGSTTAILDKYLPLRFSSDWKEKLRLAKSELTSKKALSALPPKKPCHSAPARAASIVYRRLEQCQ